MSIFVEKFFVKKAKQYVGCKIKICTVIGFPNGYQTTETKVFETSDAIKNGAKTIVSDIENVKSFRLQYFLLFKKH